MPPTYTFAPLPEQPQGTSEKPISEDRRHHFDEAREGASQRLLAGIEALSGQGSKSPVALDLRGAELVIPGKRNGAPDVTPSNTTSREVRPRLFPFPGLSLTVTNAASCSFGSSEDLTVGSSLIGGSGQASGSHQAEAAEDTDMAADVDSECCSDEVSSEEEREEEGEEEHEGHVNSHHLPGRENGAAEKDTPTAVTRVQKRAAAAAAMQARGTGAVAELGALHVNGTSIADVLATRHAWGVVELQYVKEEPVLLSGQTVRMFDDGFVDTFCCLADLLQAEGWSSRNGSRQRQELAKRLYAEVGLPLSGRVRYVQCKKARRMEILDVARLEDAVMYLQSYVDHCMVRARQGQVEPGPSRKACAVAMLKELQTLCKVGSLHVVLSYVEVSR